MTARPDSLRVLIALVAWLAQLCLPVAHAASMAGSGLGAVAWCGKDAPALQAKLAELPSEIRQILERGGVKSEHVENCSTLCAATGAPALPEPVVITVALRAAGIETPRAEPRASLQRAVGAPPPARGPPAPL